MFKILYKKILWVNYIDREVNYLENNILRKDNVYEILVKKYFNNKIAIEKILLILKKIDLKNSTELSFLAYVYALNHKWNDSISVMEKVIHLENWKNIDSWIDYWHFLRKIESYQNFSNKLLLNVYFYINKYDEKKWKIQLIKLFDE